MLIESISWSNLLRGREAFTTSAGVNTDLDAVWGSRGSKGGGGVPFASSITSGASRDFRSCARDRRSRRATSERVYK